MAFSKILCPATQAMQEDMHESLLEEGSGPPLVILPHTAGVSKDIRWVSRMNVVFRTVQSLRLIC